MPVKEKIRLAGYTVIPWKLITGDHQRLRIRLSRDLVFKTGDASEFTGGASRQEDIICYSTDEENLYVPRYYLERIRDFLKAGSTEIEAMEDRRAPGSDIAPWKFIGTLIQKPGKDQPAACAALVDTMGGILVAAPGKGKTVLCLAAAAQVQRRMLVVVPTVALMDQWINRIVGMKGMPAFTNLTRSEVGIVQGDTCEWNRSIIVAMVHSLAQKNYPRQLYSGVGIFATDECHRISAPTWSQVVPRFPAMYRWGLSATPERSDGNHRIFQLHCGEPVYEMLELDVYPTVYQLITGVQLAAHLWTNRWNGRPNFSKAFSSLALHNGRNDVLAAEITNCWKAGRKILVLSKRTQHLARLYHLAQQLGVRPDDMGTITGSVKQKDRERILDQRKVIFAIESIAGLGLDQPNLDTLIYALPSQAIEQTVGRIERVFEGKKKPLVIDPVDDVPIFRRLATNRKKKYVARGYEVINVNKRVA